MITEASSAHTNFMNEQRTTSLNSYSEMNHKLENQTAGSTEWKNTISSQVHNTHEKVEKFILEEWRRDVPTG